jgi:hypothetical protein
MAGSESGEVIYSYYATGTTNPVEKTAFWNTIKMHDMAWKIVYTLDN